MILSLVVLGLADKLDGCTGEEIPFPLVDNEPTLVKNVTNEYDGRKMYVPVVKGSAYEMGLAYGQLLKEQLPTMIKQFYGWAAGYIQNNVSFIASLPKFMRVAVGNTGVGLAKRLLDFNYLITKKYTPSRWEEEFKGVAKGAGVRLHDLRRINLIPELLKASCSLGGWWGEATGNRGLLQLRALDWEEHAPIAKFPCVTVYHPTEPGSVPFANIAWIGFLGSLTGYSSEHIGIGERLRGGNSSTMTRFGTPWTYVLRDLLQFSHNMYEALQSLQDAERTCSIYLGLGSGKQQLFHLIEYSKTELNIYDDKNWHVDKNHPRTEGMIWKAYKDELPCFKSHFVPNYGNITAELIYRYVAPRSETGDSQVAVMDHATHDLYLMYPNPVTHAPGYQRPAIRVALADRFTEWSTK